MRRCKLVMASSPHTADARGEAPLDSQREKAVALSESLLRFQKAKPSERCAERLRNEIKAMLIALDSGQELRITVSLGAAELGVDDDLSCLLARADRGLYAAKESGRDR